jgi:hypothetical protein
MATWEHFIQEEHEEDGVMRCVAVCKRCHAVLHYECGGGTGHLARHHTHHIRMDEEGAERIVEARIRRVPAIREHYDMDEYEGDGVSKHRVVCKRCQRRFNMPRGAGHGHLVRHHMSHVRMDEQAAI